MEYGAKILAARSGKRITQGGLAEALGLFVSTIVDIEYARIEISDSFFTKVMKAIDEIAENQKVVA